MATASTGLPEHHVAHHFDSADQEFDSAKAGMWLFLASEIMMFGALFVGALVFLTLHPDAFHEGSRHLDWRMGAINTFFLLTSGLTMGLAVLAAQAGRQAKVRVNIIASLFLAAGFLVVKAIEYSTKIHHGTLPGRFWHGEGFTDPFTHIFYGLYFVMTGLHGLHVLIGMGLMIFALVRSSKVQFTRAYFTPIEMVALYWALVDLVWVFLFPLLYLIG
ncbi:MAG TPA: cytochrome c oxidase subunit 3 family protein [Fibrobacteria bacterium]|nr:cytochrome c oxidase subunit 3 family protein [Fibrobacteria bacterium]